MRSAVLVLNNLHKVDQYLRTEADKEGENWDADNPGKREREGRKKMQTTLEREREKEGRREGEVGREGGREERKAERGAEEGKGMI